MLSMQRLQVLCEAWFVRCGSCLRLMCVCLCVCVCMFARTLSVLLFIGAVLDLEGAGKIWCASLDRQLARANARA